MPSAAQKLASQLGDIWLVQTYPITATGFEVSEMAHAQGLYSGLTYGGAAPAAVNRLPAYMRHYRNLRVNAGAW